MWYLAVLIGFLWNCALTSSTSKIILFPGQNNKYNNKVESLSDLCSNSRVKLIHLTVVSPQNIMLANPNSIMYLMQKLGKNYNFTENSIGGSIPECFPFSTPANDPPSIMLRDTIDQFKQNGDNSLAFVWEDESDSFRIKRQTVSSGQFISTNCILLYFQSAELILPTKTPLQLLNSSYDKNMDCLFPYVNLTFVPLSQPSSISVHVRLSLIKSARTWEVDSALITVNGTNGVETAVVATPDISSEVGMSYFCPSTTFLRSDDSLGLELTHFQIQTPSDNQVFQSARDCRGFVSIPILMGYFVFVLLAFITIGAVWMLSSIQPIQRFDDSKKPTFYIPSQDL